MFFPPEHFYVQCCDWPHTKKLVLRETPQDLLVCETADGFKISVKIPPHDPDVDYVKIENVSCTLEDGTQVQCKGYVDPSRKFMRLKGDNFWFQVEPMVW
jgi:hypothetical protein